jgi:hypothetical protein
VPAIIDWRTSGATGQLKLYGMRTAYDEIIAVVPKARFQRQSRRVAPEARVPRELGREPAALRSLPA